jgi:tight adherence protein B
VSWTFLLRSTRRRAHRRLAALTNPKPRRTLPRIRVGKRTLQLLGCCLVVSAAIVAGGPVAGLTVGAYCLVALWTVRRRHADQAAVRARVLALDALCSAAADLRAGGTMADVSIADGGGRLAWLVEALRRLADRTGAPLADLLERVAADARATDRIRTVAAAQAAGAQATAWLLAGLPAGGIALGYAIGADPLQVLLRTPIGMACTAGAIALQVAGLAWADRLTRVVTP